MKTRYIITLAACLIFAGSAWAQQGFPVTDQQPVNVEGLMCGYKIKSLETKQVSDKGNFSRYSISFWVKNVSGQPRVLPFRTNGNGVAIQSDNLVQFICLNATGYRLTNKYAVIKAPPYNYFQNGGWIKNGYAIMPGQTLSVDEIMIVPLNEQLNVEVFYIGYSQQLVPLPPAGSVEVATQPSQPTSANQPPPVFDGQSFYQIRSLNFNTFLNNQTGVINCSSIQNSWFSAQWQVIPVPGTSFVKIKNRWKGNYIAAERGYLTLVPDDQSPGAVWQLESLEGNSFRLKNIQDNGYLSMANSQVRLTPGTSNPGVMWIVQPVQ